MGAGRHTCAHSLVQKVSLPCLQPRGCHSACSVSPGAPHQDVELAGALHERVAHSRRHLVTLRQQLLRLRGAASVGRQVGTRGAARACEQQATRAAAAAPKGCMRTGAAAGNRQRERQLRRRHVGGQASCQREGVPAQHVGATLAWYCATTALSTSLPMEGSTRSSQSVPRFCRAGQGQGRAGAGRERRRRRGEPANVRRTGGMDELWARGKEGSAFGGLR